MKLISDDPDRPFVLCQNCWFCFDMDWNQDLEVGDVDRREERFEVIETMDGEWLAVKASCPNCHYTTKYEKKKIHFSFDSNAKLVEVIQLENRFLRARLRSMEAINNLLRKEKSSYARRYRKVRKQAKVLADSIHESIPEIHDEEEETESSIRGRLKEKKDFMHYR
ncbi:MAG: hypothetical protein ACYCQJ_12885 [Nitrososphaerales archaeon]